MDATGAVVIILCAGLIVAGAVMIRTSRRQRAVGAIAIVLGVIGLLAWATTEQDDPPPNATPTHGLISTTVPTEDAP